MTLEMIFALAVGLLTAAGIVLLLQARLFPVVLGLSLLTYAVNLFIVLSGRPGRAGAPIIAAHAPPMADPLPQALTLTAIVIGLAMTGYLVALMLRSISELGTDHVDGYEPDR